MLRASAALPMLVCTRTRLTGAGTVPEDLLDCVPDASPASMYFAHPAADIELVGVGSAAEICADGPARFVRAAEAVRALFARLELRGAGPEPLLVGGFGFADARPTDPRWNGMPALRFVLPERLWIRTGGETWLLRTTVIERAGGLRVVGDSGAATMAGREPVAATLPESKQGPSQGAGHGAIPGAVPDSDHGSGPSSGADMLLSAAALARTVWIDGVRGALTAIAAGSLRKVVLARACESETRATARGTVRRLRDGRAECVSFWLQYGHASFVGSSPEVLARVSDGIIDATALAGSAPRACRVADDEARAQQLLACPKNRGEHGFVADDVRRALGRVCDTVEERAVEVRSYPEAFHLATPFRGTLRAGLGLLDAARALHPTSAVCGVPREQALAMIAAVEPERGWYAGGVGWMDATGQGTLAVALRCGLVRPGSVILWAGAGIVADSDPLTEYTETEIKMDAMRRALVEPLPPRGAAHAR